MPRQPRLKNEWGLEFFGEAECIGDTWSYMDGNIRRPLLPMKVETYEMLGSIVPGPFDFAGRFGPPNETVAPEHLAVCVGYDDDGFRQFGSYVVYPSTDRRGPSRSFIVVG